VTRSNATATGVFVLGAITLLVAGILFFGSGEVFQQRIPFVSFFHGSVSGLQVGAPVTFRGVPVGQVKSIGVRFDSATHESIIQVDMLLLPGKVAVHGPHPSPDHELIPTLVQQGLTAQLERQSFVTGLLNVELDFRPDVQASRLGGDTGEAEVPTVPSQYDTITRQLEKLNLEGALQAMQRTLANLDVILTSPEVKRTIAGLPGLVEAWRHAAQRLDREVTQLSSTGREGIATTATSLQQTLATVQTLATNLDREAASTMGRADKALDSANAVLDPNGHTMLQVQRGIDDLAATAARLRNLTERVDRDPSILIRGRQP